MELSNILSPGIRRPGHQDKFLNNIDFPLIMDNSNANIAGFWKRAGAFIFDLLVINLVIIWPFEGLLQRYFNTSILSRGLAAAGDAMPQKVYYAILIMAVLALLYFTFMDYYVGQSAGMMLLNIKSISLANDMTLWKALVRNCFILPFFPFYAFWIIEPVYLIFYKDRFLERITGTRTVMVNAEKRYFQEFKLQKV
jgi:uncharacterized RDD family membrane protein YckC